VVVHRDVSAVEQRVLPEDLVELVADLIGSFGLDTWVYRGPDWYVPDPDGSHVARASAKERFEPNVTANLDGLTRDVTKLAGVSDDLDAVARAPPRRTTGSAIMSPPPGLSLVISTSPIRTPARVWWPGTCPRYGIPPEAIATIGDRPGDALMFALRLSIAMGNARPRGPARGPVGHGFQADEGLATAVERFILPQ
jgi:hypothetical protein